MDNLEERVRIRAAQMLIADMQPGQRDIAIKHLLEIAPEFDFNYFQQAAQEIIEMEDEMDERVRKYREAKLTSVADN